MLSSANFTWSILQYCVPFVCRWESGSVSGESLRLESVHWGIHCLKSVPIRSLFSRMRNEYEEIVSLVFSSNAGKYGQNNSEYGHFLRINFSWYRRLDSIVLVRSCQRILNSRFIFLAHAHTFSSHMKQEKGSFTTLSIITKRSIFDVAAALDQPLPPT